MNKMLFFAGILFPALTFPASKTAYFPSDKEVISALVKRNGLRQKNLQKILKNCDANQISINFCAYRDAVKQDLILQRAIAAWEKSRNDSCEKNVGREYGNGSMKPAAVARCQELSTKKMIDAIQGKRRQP